MNSCLSGGRRFICRSANSATSLNSSLPSGRNLMGLLDLSPNLFPIFLAHPAVLDLRSERVNIAATGFQQAQDGVQGSDDLAILIRGQPTNDVTKPVGDLGRERHGASPPAPLSMGTLLARPFLGIVKSARK